MAQVLPAFCANELYAAAAVSTERLLLHMVVQVLPEAGVASAGIELCSTRKQQLAAPGAAIDSFAAAALAGIDRLSVEHSFFRLVINFYLLLQSSIYCSGCSGT